MLTPEKERKKRNFSPKIKIGSERNWIFFSFSDENVYSSVFCSFANVSNRQDLDTSRIFFQARCNSECGGSLLSEEGGPGSARLYMKQLLMDELALGGIAIDCMSCFTESSKVPQVKVIS